MSRTDQARFLPSSTHLWLEEQRWVWLRPDTKQGPDSETDTQYDDSIADLTADAYDRDVVVRHRRAQRHGVRGRGLLQRHGDAGPSGRWIQTPRRGHLQPDQYAWVFKID